MTAPNTAYGLAAGRWAKRAALLALAATSLTCAAAFCARAADLFKYETEHYTVRTDIDPAFARLVGEHMEAIFSHYCGMFAGRGKVQVRFDVAVYATRAAYEAAVPAQVRGSTGVFVSASRMLAAHAEDRTPEEVLRTLYHEGFHQFAYYALSPRIPIWLNEGMAEYFSEATWNGTAFELGDVPTIKLRNIQQAIYNGTYVPFSELFRLNSDGWLARVKAGNDAAGLYYSQVWSIVHFLAHGDGGRHAARLNQYLDYIVAGRSEQAAFKESFGTGLAAFEAAWARYVMSLTPSPKFQCRDNMEAIMRLAQMVYGDIRDLGDVAALRRQVLSGRYRWVMTRPSGERISSSDTARVAALFRCPYDHRAAEVSYTLLRDLRTGLPVLVCPHHPGVVVKAYCEPSSSGQMAVRVEEEVLETVAPDLRRAIAASMR